MATIGLDKLYYATVTEAPITGHETYDTPVMLAKAISAELSIELAEATLWADDGAAEIIKEFKNGKLTVTKDMHLIDDELRQWFIESRDEKMRMISEEIDPGISQDCKDFCPGFSVCQG